MGAAKTPNNMQGILANSILTKRILLVAIIVTYIVIGTYYAFCIPLFEGFDEVAHYRVVDYYARRLSMPDLDRAPSHEAHQPPLYYAVGALLIAPIDRSDFDQVFQINPGSTVGVRQNIATASTAFNLQGTALAVRILRLFSTCLGALTVLLTFVLAQQLRLGSTVSLFATSLIAFNPKFIMISATVSNDIAAISAATLCLVLCVRTMGRTPSVMQAFTLGASVGLAILCKNSGLGLGLPVALALVWAVFTRLHGSAAVRKLILYGLAASAGCLVVTGWLFATQWIRYGSPLAWEQVKALNVFTLRQSPLDTWHLIAGFLPIIPSLWRVNPAINWQLIGDVISGSLLVVAVVGLVIGIRVKKLSAELFIILAAVLGSYIALVPWMMMYGGTEDSRLLPTVFSSAAVLIAVGVTTFLTSALRTTFSKGVVTVLVLINAAWAIVVPTILIAPAFPTPPTLSADAYVMQLPSHEADQLPKIPIAQFDNGIELAQVEIENDRLSSDAPINLVLVWRVTRPVMRQYGFTLQAFDIQGRLIGSIYRLPLDGQRSTSVWQVGDVYKEKYVLQLTVPVTDTPIVVSLFAGWSETVPPYRLAGVLGDTAVTAPIGRVKVRAALPPAKSQHNVDVVFGGVIRLQGYTRHDDQITLHWQSLGQVPTDYQYFIHFLDAEGKVMTQIDGALPLPAELWEEDEVVLDRKQVAGLANMPTVLVGVYSLSTGIRLPALRADGVRWQDDSVVLWGASSH